MKYMGSKRTMLANGLSATLAKHVPNARRFFDLFTGSGSVAIHVAENYSIPVIATDLQSFATSMAGAIVRRDRPILFDEWAPDWIARSVGDAERQSEALAAAKLQGKLKLERIDPQAKSARDLCAHSKSPFIAAYGGWYFSPWQALLLDALRRSAIPGTEWHDIAIAAVVQAASRCVASPGHTAQPFKSNTGAAPFLLEAWRRDVIAQISVSASALSNRHALSRGFAYEAEASAVAATLQCGDLAFIDPPYSSVHYSRFYHVLESLARGTVGAVSGTGRYPAPEERPSSAFSIPSRADAAMMDLLDRVATAGATAIVTFPAATASNGLGGSRICEIASSRFRVSEERVSSKFSTLGGDRKHRTARQDTEELIIAMVPK